MVPNQPVNGNTVGGRTSFKDQPGHIVLPDQQRIMEFAGGCQKVSSLCERTNPLFIALYRAQGPFLCSSSLPSALTAFFSLGCSGSAHDRFPQSERLRRSTLNNLAWGAYITSCPKHVKAPHLYFTPLTTDARSDKKEVLN